MAEAPGVQIANWMTVGIVPSAAAISVAARLILITSQLLQGCAVSGKWAGSALLSVEYAPAVSHGRYGRFCTMRGWRGGGPPTRPTPSAMPSTTPCTRGQKWN